ncbi:MAG: NADP-specific glutamate dehydrogenase [Deltaproteobacteria bacterium]|nr:MAG: NADP-specific glutamate dehydrogenase [Deltaproteobacteria bacterium]
MNEIISRIKAKTPGEKEFHQVVGKVMETILPVVENNPAYRDASILERLAAPDRILIFRVSWMDDQGKVQTNNGFRIEMNNALGPYKGGLRFHPSVTLGILKFLSFEQTFKNALTTLPLGGGSGGSDFDPMGKSDMEVMRFCQSFMTELFRHIGANTDVPEGDIGVGAREIGYLFGMYRKLKNEFTGVMTGKGIGWGGSLMRPEATGYGCVYFAAEMMANRWNQTLTGKNCLVSGAGNVARHTIEKLIDMGATVLTASDSSGYIYDEEGIDPGKLAYLKRLKTVRRGRISEYADKYPAAVYTPTDATLDHHPLWSHRADCAFPCATENEINEKDAYNLVNNGIRVICECANMPCTPEAVDLFTDRKNILYAPAKAASAGGVAVSGLEMAQNNMRLTWTREEVDKQMKVIIKQLHQTCLDAAEQYSCPGNYMVGANIAGFSKVVDAMLDQGLV